MLSLSINLLSARDYSQGLKEQLGLLAGERVKTQDLDDTAFQELASMLDEAHQV